MACWTYDAGTTLKLMCDGAIRVLGQAAEAYSTSHLNRMKSKWAAAATAPGFAAVAGGPGKPYRCDWPLL